VEDIDAAIGQFLDFARLRDAEAAVPRSDLNALVEHVAGRYVQAGKTVRCALSPVPPLPLRARAIQRLLGNLIDNGLRYGNGEVDVATGNDQRTAFIEVCDRGPGIPREEAERMLQPFTRLDAARGGSGSGLGLAIVDRVARMHGGAVSLLPRDGGGLRARVELPIPPDEADGAQMADVRRGAQPQTLPRPESGRGSG
jgi:two-component system osmolarity sensor histidine kinase EnvZ